MAKRSKREQLRYQRRKARLRNTIIWGGLGVIALSVPGYLIWNGLRPAAGESVPIMAANHIPDDAKPAAYNTDPPTSGHHYASSFQAGFYEVSDLPSLPENPVGYLVHNLEHGYVIFWYNCIGVDEAECETLKGQIGEVMDRFDGFKLIAFPWESQDEPVVMTSWGRIQRFETFDIRAAARFVERNRNRAPEPNAP